MVLLITVDGGLSSSLPGGVENRSVVSSPSSLSLSCASLEVSFMFMSDWVERNDIFVLFFLLPHNQYIRAATPPKSNTAPMPAPAPIAAELVADPESLEGGEAIFNAAELVVVPTGGAGVATYEVKEVLRPADWLV